MSRPTARRRQLGRALRKAREDAGLTQSAVAIELGCRQAKINKIESTLVGISMADLDRMIEIYRIPAAKAVELRELASLDQAYGPKRTVVSTTWSAFEHLRDLEQDAHEILCWHGERIPKPLQSEYYLLKQHHPDTKTPADVVRALRQLEARARIFTLDDPPLYRVILSESSLRRMPGGYSPKLVVDQVEHLLDFINRYDQLRLQILKFEAPIPFVDTDFEILRFNGVEPDFAYIEAAGGARTFERPDEINRFEEHWRELSASALSLTESKAFLERLLDDSKKEWIAEESD